ncbi:MAG TPA: tetratricopeptide repeat protein [Planctomycetota bacterium]|nr:tetratricopeptide repeat protein [Planctomycetota bacterium]
MSLCAAVLAVVLMHAPAQAAEPADPADPAKLIEQEKAALERERQELVRQLTLAEKAEEDARLQATSEIQEVLAPAGLTITSPPGPLANQLYTIRAEQVKFRDILLCLARNARVNLRIADGIHSSTLNDTLNVDLRLVSLDDAIEILCGSVGLAVVSGIDAQDRREILVAQYESLGEDVKLTLEQKAIEVWTRFLLKFPDDARAVEAYYQIAEVHFNQKEYALASQDYRLVLEHDRAKKFMQQARLRLGRCYSELGDYKAAAKVLYEFLDAAPSPAQACEALFALARAAVKANEPNEAVRAYSRLLLEFSTSESAPLARHELAAVIYAQKEYESALRHLEILKQSAPAYEPQKISFKAGMCKMNLEQWDAAAADFVAVLKKGKQDSLSADSYYHLATCLDKRGGGLDALEAYVGAAARFAQHPAAAAARARATELYVKSGLVERAVSYGDEAVRNTAGAAVRLVKAQLARALLSAKQYDRARVLFEELAQEPGDGISKGEAMLCAGEAAGKLEQHERAEVLFRGAMQSQPDKDQRRRAMRGLGDCFLARGEYQRAALAYQGIDPSENSQQ